MIHRGVAKRTSKTRKLFILSLLIFLDIAALRCAILLRLGAHGVFKGSNAVVKYSSTDHGLAELTHGRSILIMLFFVGMTEFIGAIEVLGIIAAIIGAGFVIIAMMREEEKRELRGVTNAVAAGIKKSKLESIKQPDGPGHFIITGVDRETKMDTTDFIAAVSPENAKAKAELSGVVVTRVERV